MTRFLMGGAAAIALMPAVAVAQCDDGEQVANFSHVTSASGHPKGEMAAALAERVNAEMDGTLCIEVFPNGSLFDDDRVLEAMVLGDVQLAAPDVGKFDSYTQALQVFNLPFLFDSTEAVQRFTEGETGQGLLTSMEDQGIVGLAYVYNGLRQFSAGQPLISPSDAEGLLFRVTTSDVTEAMISQLGATPQALNFPEVYGALQNGVVDGQENTWSNIWTERFFEVQDGITETNHQFLTYLMVASQQFLDSLDEPTREQFLSLVDEVSAEYNARANEINAEARQSIIDAGGTVRELDDAQRQEWVDAMRPVWSQFEDAIGTDVIEAAQAANEG